MILFILGFLLNIAVSFTNSSVVTFTWKRNVAINNYITASGSLSSTYVPSQFKCGQLCTSNDKCLAFFYHGDSNLCHLESSVNTATAGLNFLAGTIYHSMTAEQLSERICLMDYSQFQLVMLSDGSYLRIHARPRPRVNMADARAYCINNQSKLFQPKSQARIDLLVELFKCPGYTEYYLVDGHISACNSPWTTWDNAHTYTVTNWDGSQPDLPNTEHCLQVTPSGRWNDYVCTMTSGVICERDP